MTDHNHDDYGCRCRIHVDDNAERGDEDIRGSVVPTSSCPWALGGKVLRSNSHLNDKLEDPSLVLEAVWRSNGECGDGVFIDMVVCDKNEREGMERKVEMSSGVKKTE
jgi:hypothetical protein